MKKVLAIVLSFVMTLCVLCACANDETKLPVGKKDDGVLDALGVLTKSAEAMKNVKDMSADMDMNLSMFIKSEGIEMNLDMIYDMAVEASLEKMLYHTSGKMTMMGITSPMESYMDMNSPMTTYTATPDGDWYKTVSDEKESKEFEDLMKKSLELQDKVDYSKIMQDLEMTDVEYEGKTVYEITGNINVEKILSEFDVDLDELIKEAEADEELPAGAVNKIFESIGKLPYTMGIDKQNFYIVYVKSDLTDCAKELVDKILEISAEMGEEALPEGSLFSIEECVIEAVYRDYNDTNVEIPEEVLAAPEQDEYYDSLYDDEYYYDDYYDDEYYYDDYSDYDFDYDDIYA